MRAVIQRVSQAEVRIGGALKAMIQDGLLVLALRYFSKSKRL
jgi:D-Tyr-tRNAtyr deacylase